MGYRRFVVCILTAALAPLPAGAAQYATQNFVVNARNADIARQVARYAEYYRRVKAAEWLGHELSGWSKPCSVDVRITLGGAGGATSFTFDNGRILNQQMTVEGSLERILHSVLPHEVTHTVFAAKFRRPLPRWADEGGAVLSEDDLERARHHEMVRELAQDESRLIPLYRLFVLTEYPRDVMALYAQGFSVAHYLVSLGGKPKFLDFVWEGQQAGWDYALRRYYGFRSVQQLESQWRLTLARPVEPSTQVVASAGRATRAQSASPRIVRGQTPEEVWPAARPSPIAPARPIAISRPIKAPLGRPMTGAATFPEALGTPATAAAAAGNTIWQPAHNAGIGNVRSNVAATASTPYQQLAPTTPNAHTDSSTKDHRAASARPADYRRLIPIAVGRTRRAHQEATDR